MLANWLKDNVIETEKLKKKKNIKLSCQQICLLKNKTELYLTASRNFPKDKANLDNSEFSDRQLTNLPDFSQKQQQLCFAVKLYHNRCLHEKLSNMK